MSSSGTPVFSSIAVAARPSATAASARNVTPTAAWCSGGRSAQLDGRRWLRAAVVRRLPWLTSDVTKHPLELF